ncbi:FAD:protein FMN transferase [Shimia ponticola]|uniref:FAD:protein FMN transferase n=1 Tax=Shimia ponticola TaxID=2582893 RepID=UPI0011BE77DC|nr:FAD:protein FMN transferase [Shimia ponticola]
MSMNRRRFIAISAACIASAATAATHRWNGRALGAEVSIELHGGDQSALDAAVTTLLRLERAFSLYDPTSELSHLNDNGQATPSPDMRAILQEADIAHRLTGGLFDPTIQTLWDAAAHGYAADPDTFGWDQVEMDDQVTLAPGQKLTLNGIAQGFITDRVRDVLIDHGLTHALINIGEHLAIGGPFRLGLSDPAQGLVGQRSLMNSAIATSSPGALRLGAASHIMHPAVAPVWSTVSVEAADATRADALSTAMCLMSKDAVWDTARKTGSRVTLVDDEGDVTTIS